MRRSSGFSLWELLWTLLIAAVLVGLGAPSFRTVALDTRRTADINGFVLAVQLARSEAAKRGWPAIVCPSPDGVRCAGGQPGYGAGWIVFVNEDDVRPPQRAAAEPLLYVHRPDMNGTIVGNRDWFEFVPFRRRSTNGTVVFCDERGARTARAVIVSYTGRPRVDSVAADGKPLICARLP
jgi:type IV fimbrial biogenesis protein FimT